jgi:hypothetical protein
MKVPPDALLKQLAAAAEGLLYPSETDAPFLPFAWETMRDFSVEKLLFATRHDRNTPVEGTEFHDFFKPLVRIEEWFDDAESATALSFENLRDTLSDLLGELSVYRIGTVNIDIYVIGKTDDGYFAGVSTKAVET